MKLPARGIVIVGCFTHRHYSWWQAGGRIKSEAAKADGTQESTGCGGGGGLAGSISKEASREKILPQTSSACKGDWGSAKYEIAGHDFQSTGG